MSRVGGTLLHGGVDATGARVDVLVDESSGRVVAAGPDLAGQPADAAVDCTGLVVLPAPAEPHAHLDKALSAERLDIPCGDLGAAILAWHAEWPTLTSEDILERARAAAHELVVHGTTAIRSHVDVGEEIGLRGVEALATLREELRAQGLAELQIVALVTVPLTGDEGAPQRALLEAAIEAGVDVVGGCPHLDPDPAECTRVALEVADRHGLPVDLHSDETLNPDKLALPVLARLVRETGFAHGATASHCVSLGVQTAEVQAEVAQGVAEAGVAVVTLPQTNLFLQARGIDVAPPRGLTGVRALLDAGATLAAGADNVRDPFNRVGRSDAFETAALLVMAAHLDPSEAWHAVSHAARTAMGLEPAALQPGAPAELVAAPGASVGDAIARAGEGRVVVHHGRVVARTTVTTELHPTLIPSDTEALRT